MPAIFRAFSLSSFALSSSARFVRVNFLPLSVLYSYAIGSISESLAKYGAPIPEEYLSSFSSSIFGKCSLKFIFRARKILAFPKLMDLIQNISLMKIHDIETRAAERTVEDILISVDVQNSTAVGTRITFKFSRHFHSPVKPVKPSKQCNDITLKGLLS